MVSAPHGRRTVRPPARPLRVLDPRRRVPDPRPRQARRGARDAGCLAHRSRLDGGRRAALQGGQGNRRQADRRLRGLRRRRPPRAEEGLRAPHAARRRHDRLLEPDQAVEPRLPRGLLLQAARRLGAARAARGRRDRALRLPVGPGLQGARGEPRLGCGRRARPARAGLRPRQRLRRAAERPPRGAGSGSCRSSSSSPARPGSRRSRPATSTTSATRTRARTRRCSASSRATRSRTRTTGSSTPTTSTSRRAEEMAGDFPGQEEALRRTLEVAERCNVEIALDRILLPKFPVPDGREAFDYLVELCEKGLAKRYETVTDELTRPAPLRAEDDQRDGVHRLLPDRLGLHPLREAARDQRRPGPRLGRREPRLLLPRDHRPRPDPLRPAVRAVPQPGPQDDARHGHRLRGRRPRARHQLRHREVRPRPRRADHHLLDDGRPRRRPRRRARARDPLRRRRPDREADPGRTGPDARGVPEARRRAAQGGRLRPGREGDRRPRAARSRASPAPTRSTPPAS